MAENSLKQKITSTVDNVKYYWNDPPKGRFMSFKEIIAYAGGGIGAYFIISMGTALAVSTTNLIVGGAIGVDAMDMYILYLIATIANIPLTAVAYVWFPYERLGVIFSGEMFGKSGKYVATCAVVLIFNLLLQFFFNFFNDAYTNLIHVLSPNTQERTDVLAIKSVVYSLAPSIINIVLPLIAQFATNNNLYDIKVYRIAYPIFAVIGMALTIVVFANTKEKIVQAKTHTIQISFIDSFKAVAKNKYFWIIALAGWVGFLESAYGSILSLSYNYGHTCNGGQFALIQTLTGNAALWGMILAPICIRKWGKKKVLIAVNFANILCILAMIINMHSIWWLFVCVYFNWLVGAFEQIITPAIQADIRDYQQYRTGERIDGMFAAVLTIGNLVTLATSSVLPMVQKHYGVYEGNGYEKAFDILDVNTGEPGLLYKLMGAFILMAALGAFLNMVPYFFYDFTEMKQKCVVSVLKVRSLFEDYGNKALDDHQIVEAIDLVREAREMAVAQPKAADKKSYKSMPNGEERKQAKKNYKAALEFNEKIKISKFVCDELDKFDSQLMKHEVSVYKGIYAQGLAGIKNSTLEELNSALSEARKLPKETDEEKAFRKFEIEIAKNRKSAKKAYDKYFGSVKEFKEPDMAALTSLFEQEDACEAQIYELNKEKLIARKAKANDKVAEINVQIKQISAKSKEIDKKAKKLQDEFAQFNRAAKPYMDARKLLIQEENFKHFDEIAALYDEAKLRAEEADRIKETEAAAKRAEELAELEAKKAEKAQKKAERKNKK